MECVGLIVLWQLLAIHDNNLALDRGEGILAIFMISFSLTEGFKIVACLAILIRAFDEKMVSIERN